MIFGRTDLRKGVSGAKFDAESDFEVRLDDLAKIAKKFSRFQFVLDFFSVFRYLLGLQGS